MEFNSLYNSKYIMTLIRDFDVHDISELVEILKLNRHYNETFDGPEAMKRIKSCDAAIFLVSEVEGGAVGFIRVVYDGSRAIIHLLSVHPNYQHRGIGTALVKEITKKFMERGAPGIEVTVVEESSQFWEKVGFSKSRAFVMLASVNNILRKRT